MGTKCWQCHIITTQCSWQTVPYCRTTDRETSLSTACLHPWRDRAECRWEQPAVDDVVVQYVARYGGARSCKHLNMRTANLNDIRCLTGSQCNSRNVGDMWSYFLAPVTRHVDAFCISCSLCNSWSLIPTNMLLQQSSRPTMKACTSVLVISGVKQFLIVLSWQSR